MKLIERIKLFRLSLVTGTPTKKLSLRENLRHILQDWEMARRGHVRILARGARGRTHMDLMTLLTTTSETHSAQSKATQMIKGRVKLTARPKRVYRAKEGKWYDVEDVWRNAK